MQPEDQPLSNILDRLKGEFDQLEETRRGFAQDKFAFIHELANHTDQAAAHGQAFAELEARHRAMVGVYEEEKQKLLALLAAKGVPVDAGLLDLASSVDAHLQRIVGSAPQASSLGNPGGQKKHEPFSVTCWDLNGRIPVAHPRAALAGWSVSSVDPGASLQHEAVVSAAKFSWDGAVVASGSKNALHLFDANTGESRGKATFTALPSQPAPPGGRPFEFYVRGIAFSSTNRYLFVGGEDPAFALRVFDLQPVDPATGAAGDLAASLASPSILQGGHSDHIYALGAASQCDLVVSGGADSKLALWRPAESGSGWELKRSSVLVAPEDLPFAQKDPVSYSITALAVSADGRKMLVGSQDGQVCLVDSETGRELTRWKARLGQGHTDTVYGAAMASTGMLVTGGFDRTCRVWDERSPSCVATLSGHKDFVLGLGVSADGQRIYSGSKDRTVAVWETQAWSRYLSIVGHPSSITCLDVAARKGSDSKDLFCTGGADTTVRLWSVRADTVLHP